MKRSVFQGIKVVDFSWAVVGPYSVKFLSDYGATVIHVESSLRLDSTRTYCFKDRKPGIDQSLMFAYIHPNCMSVALDLNNPASRKVTKKLVQWADVIYDGFRPGTLEKWGLGYEEVYKINPNVIMMRVSAYGQTGPRANVAAYGIQLTGLAGFAHYTGWPDGSPLPLLVAYTDTIAPHFAGAALIAALEYRRKTGEGQLLDMAQLETAEWFLAPPILDYMVNKNETSRTGNRCAFAAPHGTYPTRGEDRWCAIAVLNDEEWSSFCHAIGDPEWTKDPKFATLMGRKENEVELDKLVTEWTRERTAEDIMKILQAAGVNAGVVQNPVEVYHDPQLKHRDFVWKMKHKVLGDISHLGSPIRLSKTPARGEDAAPCLGEHTEYVCKEILGMSGEEFDELLIGGVIQ